jgi:surface antigen
MKKTLLFLFILLINTAAWAEVYDFLNETPGSYFTDRDWTMVLSIQKKALNNTRDGATLAWKNPENGHWGTIKPSHTMVEEGVRCRDLTVFNEAEGRTGGGTLRYCKIHGLWKGV